MSWPDACTLMTVTVALAVIALALLISRDNKRGNQD